MSQGLQRVPQGLRNAVVETVGVRVIGDRERVERIRIGAGTIGMTGTVIAVGTDESIGNVLVRFDAEFYDRLCEEYARVYIPKPSNRPANCECLRPHDLNHWTTSGAFEVVDTVASIPEGPLMEPQVVKKEVVGEASQQPLW
jgi:hypothetical protein